MGNFGWLDPNIVAAVIGPLLTALLATGAVGFGRRKYVLRAEQERARVLEQATQEAAFLNAWLSARERLNLDPGLSHSTAERALADLERLYETVRAVDLSVDIRSTSLTFAGVAKTILLIPLQRPWAKVVRVVYYLYGALALLGSVGLLAVVLDGGSGGQAENTATFWITLVVGWLFYFLPGLGLWWLAHSLNRPRAASVADQISVTGHPPTWGVATPQAYQGSAPPQWPPTAQLPTPWPPTPWPPTHQAGTGGPASSVRPDSPQQPGQGPMR